MKELEKMFFGDLSKNEKKFIKEELDIVELLRVQVKRLIIEEARAIDAEAIKDIQNIQNLRLKTIKLLNEIGAIGSSDSEAIQENAKRVLEALTG